MELRHLKYFMAVAEELHFRKASEKLFIAQPALSRQIKLLEEELNILLLQRTKRAVVLTEAGKYFYKEVKELFSSLEQIKTKAKEIESGSYGKIKIGYVGSSMLSVLPKIITRVQKSLPDLHFELHEMPAMVQVEMLKADKIDIGFLRVPREDKDIIMQTIFTETYSVVLPNDHKLNAKNFKGLYQLANEKFILPPRLVGQRYFDNIISLCTAAGFSPNIAHESLYENAIVRLVENNLGVSIFPSSFSKEYNAKVKFIELKKIPQRLQLSIAWKKENNNPALLTMIKLIRKTVG